MVRFPTRICNCNGNTELHIICGENKTRCIHCRKARAELPSSEGAARGDGVHPPRQVDPRFHQNTLLGPHSQRVQILKKMHDPQPGALEGSVLLNLDVSICWSHISTESKILVDPKFSAKIFRSNFGKSLSLDRIFNQTLFTQKGNLPPTFDFHFSVVLGPKIDRLGSQKSIA